MGRRRRIVLPGFPHHVTARGNRRADVFRDTEDRLVYLSKLRGCAERHRVALYSYSLMTNHTHKIAVPSTRDSLSCLMHDLNGAYAAYFNRKYGHCGHLWQKRFFACVLDEAHLWNAVRYVERNPVRAGLVERAEDYRWSSAPAHCGLRADQLLDKDFPPAGLVPDWAAWLATDLSDEQLEEIRSNTQKGIPWASVPFLRELEGLLGIPLLPRKKGRKSPGRTPGAPPWGTGIDVEAIALPATVAREAASSFRLRFPATRQGSSPEAQRRNRENHLDGFRKPR